MLPLGEAGRKIWFLDKNFILCNFSVNLKSFQNKSLLINNRKKNYTHTHCLPIIYRLKLLAPDSRPCMFGLLLTITTYPTSSPTTHPPPPLSPQTSHTFSQPQIFIYIFLLLGLLSPFFREFLFAFQKSVLFIFSPP